MLVAAPGHWPGVLFCNLVQQAVQVLRHRESLVHHRPALGDVAPDLPQAVGDLTARLAVDPLPSIAVEDDCCRPASVSPLYDRSLAVASAPRAHRGLSIFDGWPQPAPGEAAVNALEGTVLRVPCQAAAGRAETRLSPASAATSWTSRKPSTMHRPVSPRL